ncbi:hypothetical protein [Endozoicomonas atrinae]|uniref:hypothetical protein n=1 Tax=Endozoicomonas atrinae TaxID=1333660 RepID=UPI000826829C|nr:hypothetical protein [Endozoicomonas atrinae]
MDRKQVNNESQKNHKIIYSVDISEPLLDRFLALAKQKKTSGSKILQKLMQEWTENKGAE